MRRSVGQLGFTLIELLVASAIMAIILGALGNLFVSTRDAYRANEEATALQQTADAVGQLLTYEIGLAGYRGSDNNASTRTFTTPVVFGLLSFPATTLQIETGLSASTPDEVYVSYYEDRYVSNTAKLGTEFSVDTTNHNLDRYLSTDTAKRAIIRGVHNLKVLRYVRRDGKECNTATAANLAALRLEFTLTDGLKKQTVVPLQNPQVSPVLPVLSVLANSSGC